MTGLLAGEALPPVRRVLFVPQDRRSFGSGSGGDRRASLTSGTHRI